MQSDQCVVLLALEEKGYAREEYDLKIVDLGESFVPLSPPSTDCVDSQGREL